MILEGWYNRCGIPRTYKGRSIFFQRVFPVLGHGTVIVPVLAVGSKNGQTLPAAFAAGVMGFTEKILWHFADDDVFKNAFRTGEPDNVAGTGPFDFRSFYGLFHGIVLVRW